MIFPEPNPLQSKNRHVDAKACLDPLESPMNDFLDDAFAVLLPAFDGLEAPPWLSSALRGGLRSVLVGESRDEYVNRQMSESRVHGESADDFITFTRDLTDRAGAPLLVAVDQEPWGIQRLHRLVPESPVSSTNIADFEHASYTVAVAAKSLGVNMFLSPVVDMLSAPNPWLQGRTLVGEPALVGELAAAFVRGVQSAGIASVVKHFPGFTGVLADPAVEVTHVPAGAWNEASLLPFQGCIGSGASGIMTGPAPVLDLDPVESASTSSAVIGILREKLNFTGLVVSDDLDAPATLQGRTLSMTAVASLQAGANLLLVSGGDHLHDLARSIAHHASHDRDLAGKLLSSARRVRELASKLGTAAD